jgi:hypothetical protein
VKLGDVFGLRSRAQVSYLQGGFPHFRNGFGAESRTRAWKMAAEVAVESTR